MNRAENITPRILTWAREKTGLSVEDAAMRLGLKSTTRGTAIEKLEAFERGDVKPTRKQLLKIAATYRRPLTTFYRVNPPVTGNRGEDFRTMAGAVTKEEAGLLDALLRDIRARQDMVRSILEDDEDVRPLVFVGSIQVKQNIVDTAQLIRQVLELTDDDVNLSGLNMQDAPPFAALRERVERIGVFVLLVGNLGSHHTNISERIFRGFAISDDIAPFIVINDQDAVSARSFTLVHELAHIFMGSTGVSDAPSTVASNTESARVERFCNDVASEFLLPLETIQGFDRFENFDFAAGAIAKVAEGQKVSEAMVAYRFWRIGYISDGTYQELVAAYTARWRDNKLKSRERAREENLIGPSYYTVRKHRLGNALIDLVGRTLRSNELTHTKAAKMLGVKPVNVEPLLRGVKSVSGSYFPERG